jgi:hypothetical protein
LLENVGDGWFGQVDVQRSGRQARDLNIQANLGSHIQRHRTVNEARLSRSDNQRVPNVFGRSILIAEMMLSKDFVFHELSSSPGLDRYTDEPIVKVIPSAMERRITNLSSAYGPSFFSKLARRVIL